MSRIILVTYLMISSLCLRAQTDTSMLYTGDTINSVELFSIPFSKEELGALDVRDNIVEEIHHSKFKSKLFLFLLNLLTIAVLLLEFSRSKVKKILATLFNVNMLKQYAKVEMKRDNNFLPAYFLLVAIFFILTIYIMSRLFGVELNIFNVGVSVVLFFIFDILINKLSSFIMKDQESYSSLLFNNASFMILLLPILIIGVLFLVFLPEFFSKGFSYFFAVFIFGIFLWKEIRNVYILSSCKIKVVSFYFFLYLCTFKILPFIILFKVISVEIIK